MSLTVLFTLFCWQLIRLTTWWAVMDRVTLSTTSWPPWRRLPQASWHAAGIPSIPSSLMMTSKTSCPGSGTSTSRKTGQTKRGLCVRGQGNQNAPHMPPSLCHLVCTISAFFVLHFMLSCLSTHLESLHLFISSSSRSSSSSSHPTLCLSIHLLSGFTGCSWVTALPLPNWTMSCSTFLPQIQPWICLCSQIDHCLKRLTTLSTSPDGVVFSVWSTFGKATIQSALIWPF